MSPLLLMVISNLLNFGILAFLLWKFLIPKLSEFMDKKTADIAQSIDEAEKHLNDMSAELVEVRSELANSQAEIEQIRTEAESRGEASSEKIRQETQQEILQLKARVERQIEQEFSTLRSRVRRDLVSQVMLQAEVLIQQHSDKLLQTRVIEDFAYRLGDFKEYKS